MPKERWNDRAGAFNPVSAPDYLPRAQLRELQSQRLRAMVARAWHNVALFRERMQARGLTPDAIGSIDDIATLPFTVKADLRDTYPFGLFASPMDEVVRLHASSGTTGKPIVVAYTQEDLDVWTEAMARTFAACGLHRGDILQNAFGYGLSLLLINVCVVSLSVIAHSVLLEAPDDLPATRASVPAAAETSVVLMETVPNALEQTLLFSPSRTRLAPATAEPEVSPSAMLPRLVGIMIDGHKRTALLEAASTASRKVVAEGDLFDGWVVMAIAAHAVRLQGRSTNEDKSHAAPSVEIRLRQLIQPSQDPEQ